MRRLLGSRVLNELSSRVGWFPARNIAFLRRLDARAFHLPAVPVEKTLSASEFEERYGSQGLPVKVSDPRRRERVGSLTLDGLLRDVGDLRGPMRRVNDYTRMRERGRPEVSVRDYVERCFGWNTATSDYLTHIRLPASLVALIGDVESFSGDFELQTGQLWIGAPRTGAPLHRDLSDNWLIQLMGRKHIFLVAPTHSDRFVTYGVDETLQAADPPAEEARARGVHVHEVELGPGDMLYVPAGWFHQVSNQEDMVSANVFSWRTRSDPTFEQERAASPGRKIQERFPGIRELAARARSSSGSGDSAPGGQRIVKRARCS